jgi:hypothetical protein
VKLNQIFENTAAGAVSAGDVGGVRGHLFGGSKPQKRKKPTSKVQIIRYHHENRWNVK